MNHFSALPEKFRVRKQGFFVLGTLWFDVITTPLNMKPKNHPKFKRNIIWTKSSFRGSISIVQGVVIVYNHQVPFLGLFSTLLSFIQLDVVFPFVYLFSSRWVLHVYTLYTHFNIQYMYLEPGVCTLPKKALSIQNKGHLGSRYYNVLKNLITYPRDPITFWEW